MGLGGFIRRVHGLGFRTVNVEFASPGIGI